jgi:hypothetical protein
MFSRFIRHFRNIHYLGPGRHHAPPWNITPAFQKPLEGLLCGHLQPLDFFQAWKSFEILQIWKNPEESLRVANMCPFGLLKSWITLFSRMYRSSSAATYCLDNQTSTWQRPTINSDPWHAWRWRSIRWLRHGICKEIRHVGLALVSIQFAFSIY